MEKNYMDPTLSPERRAELLLREMTTAEKLAQLTGVMAIRGREGRMGDFLKNGIGQISTLDFRNRETYVEAAAWQRQLQEIVMMVCIFLSTKAMEKQLLGDSSLTATRMITLVIQLDLHIHSVTR